MNKQEFVIKRPYGFIPQPILQEKKPETIELIIITHTKKDSHDIYLT